MNPKHLKNVTCIQSNKYDFFFTDNISQNKPIIINIHGGGFMAGDKKYRRYWCEVLANEGWFVINVNYCLCPSVTIIEQIHDVWSTLQDLPNFTEEYHPDLSKIVITGDSSGAFLAAYMIALSTNPELRQELNFNYTYPINFLGTILFCGVYNLVYMLETDKNNSKFIKEIAQSLTGRKYKTVSDIKSYQFYPQMEIDHYVTPNWCPTQIFYAKKDYFVKGQGELFVKALERNNIQFEENFSESFFDNHCYHLFFHTKISKKSIVKVKQFLSKLLKD